MKGRSLLFYKVAVLAALILTLGSQIPASLASPTTPPVLVVVNDNQTYKWGRYLGEILRLEGLNEYDIIDISTMTSGGLSQYPVVVLAQTALTSAQATTLSGYVNGGGRLMAMRPDAPIKGLFGLNAASGTQTDGYLKFNAAATIDSVAPAQGLVTNTLQIHGSVSLFTTTGSAVTLAQLYSNATTATAFPAVVSAPSGTGRGIAFLYDLPSNIINMRQGNIVNSTYVHPSTHVTGDVDGDGVYRTIDLFEKIGGGAPWVDLNNVPIPQADEQTRYFGRLVKLMVSEVQPAPQLWYFPGNAMTMMVMTGDAHANPEASFTQEVNSIVAHHGNITIYPAIASNPVPSDVKTWMTNYGFTFGIHPYANRPDSYPPYNITNLQQGYQAFYNWFNSYYNVSPYNIPMSATVRNHQVAWAGWTDSADYAAAYGIAMDTSFYHWGAWLQKSDGTWPHGYITGSGQPMKFIRSDGTILPVYQQLTELVDEQMLNGTDAGFEFLTGTQGVAVSQQMIDASLGGYYETLMTQNHVDYYVNGDPQDWAEGTMDYAYSKGVPIWNADKWLTFTQTRHDANYSNFNWDQANATLSFNLTAASAAGMTLTTVLPPSYAGNNLQSVLVDGVTAAKQTIVVNGTNQVFVSVPAGNHTFTVYYKALTPTATSLPGTATATSTRTATATTVPPTSTITSTPTATLPGPTSTFTATSTSTSTRTATSTATSSGPTSTPAPTATPAPGGGNLVQTSFSDFGPACVAVSGAHVSDLGGGAVALAASFADDFPGSSLNGSLWTAGTWAGGAYSPTVSGSVLSILNSAGAWVRSVPVYTHGVIEATAQFGNAAFQHIGFGSDQFSGNRYFLFSTYTGDGNLYARVNNNVSEQRANLGAVPSGMHRYRIEWTALDASNDQVAFFIDGSQVASMSVTNAGASGFYLYLSNSSGTVPLQVDAAQVSPTFVASGSYTSCPLDAGAGNLWQTISWDPSLPAGTGASVQVQTSANGTTWSGWSGAANPAGTALAAPQRFVQYRLLLSTSNNQSTPLINSVTLAFNPSNPATATSTKSPTATSIAATSTKTPVPPTSTNTAVPPTSTNTAAAPTNTFTPTVTSPGPTSTFTPTFTAGPTNTRTATPVPPTSTNTATPVPPTNTATATATPGPTSTQASGGGNLVQTSFSDFGPACVAVSGAHVSDLGGGAVALAASFADDFPGSSLNGSLWTAGTWAGGAYSPTVSGSVLSILNSAGAWVRSAPVYTHGVIEATAQFGNAAFQHIGFASDQFSGNRYFLFSTYTGDGNLYARVNNNVSEQRANLGAVPSGMHRYRIEWTALDASNDQVAFFIDGSQVASMSVTNAGASGFYLYLSNSSGTVPLQVDAAQVSPTFVASGSYTSCPLDAGAGNLWQTISWDPSLPAGTGASVQVQTSANGTTWSGWSGAANPAGTALAAPQRFVQYRLLLSTSNNQSTPLINSVNLAFNPGP